MINNNYPIHFGARFDQKTYEAIIQSTKCPEIRQCAIEKMMFMEKWGDADSFISLIKDEKTGLYKYVLKNLKINSKKSRQVSDDFGEKSIFTGFLSLRKEIIENAEKFLQRT